MRIHAIQHPSHYYFAKNNGRAIQNDDRGEDIEGALLNLYANLVKGVKTTIEWSLYKTLLIYNKTETCNPISLAKIFSQLIN